jgi:hypothetical protein
MPGTNTKQDLLDYLNTFLANKEVIITGFNSIVGHPEKAYQWGFSYFTTYETMLLDRLRCIKEMSEYIQAQFEKLILLIDSEKSG